MSCQAMLRGRDEHNDCEKPKMVGVNSIDPEWIHPIDQKSSVKRVVHWDREPTWWERGLQEGAAARDCLGSSVNIFYSLILLTELVLWIKVLLVWRSSPSDSIYCLSILLPLLLPTLVLPLLAVLHSLVKGRLSYSSALLLFPPPSPVIVHLLIIYRKLSGEEHAKVSLAARAAGLAQSLLMSFPLLVFSLVTLVRATVGEDKVVMEHLHQHLFENNLQPLAATVSLINLVVSVFRYNERETGRAVALLVGFPFLATNMIFRLFGFCLLFAYFDLLWVLLVLGLLFCVAALGVQLGAGQSMCSSICRKLVASVSQDDESASTSCQGPGVIGCLLLSVANVLVPAGYSRDHQLGHVKSAGGRLLVVTWLGSISIICLVINHSLATDIPNTYTGLAPVDMSMIMPKTGLAVNIPNMALGGLDLKLVLPKTKMTMLGDHPASYELQTSGEQDIVLALIIPLLLALTTVPFTFLRALLLGWNCVLVSQARDKQRDIDNPPLAGKARNCLSVCCGVSGMMMFTSLLALTVVAYVLVILQSTTNPLTREVS